MKFIHLPSLAIAGAAALGGLGCSSGATPGSAGRGFDIRVAPLDLPLMTDACYGLTVYRLTEGFDADDIVWAQPDLCASQYGAEGGIRFTGVCDASGPGGQNAVRLVLNSVYQDGAAGDGGTALTAGEDYINPCPPAADDEDNGCVLLADCEPSQDTKVEFNLTVMRSAEVGFYDTVVKFHDVFCAAKLDCVEEDGTTTLTYLHDPGTGQDGPTAVLGFVCLGGSGDDVSMYLDDVVVECATGSGETYTVTRTATIDPSAGPGNLAAPALSHTGPSSPLFGAAVNIGTAFQGARYWNVLLGLELDGPSGEVCRIKTRGTVSEGDLTDATTPAHNRYPYIDWNVVLTSGATRTCTRHPLDAASGVSTEYTGIDAPEVFDHELALEAACPCWERAALAAAVDAIRAQPGYAYYWQIGPDEVGFDLGVDGDWVSVEIEDGQCAASIGGPWVQAEPSGPQLAACEADLAELMENPCAEANGGCAGSAPHCEYTGFDASRCTECLTNAECTSPNVCDTSGAWGNPETQHMCVECSGPLFACPVGLWCAGDGACQTPGSWHELGAASFAFPDNAAAAAACAAQGGRRLPEAWELKAAMTAQFVYGTTIPGVVFQAGQYYGVRNSDDSGVTVWLWDGSQLGGPWNNSWGNGTFAVCLP